MKPARPYRRLASGFFSAVTSFAGLFLASGPASADSFLTGTVVCRFNPPQTVKYLVPSEITVNYDAAQDRYKVSDALIVAVGSKWVPAEVLRNNDIRRTLGWSFFGISQGVWAPTWSTPTGEATYRLTVFRADMKAQLVANFDGTYNGNSGTLFGQCRAQGE